VAGGPSLDTDSVTNHSMGGRIVKDKMRREETVRLAAVQWTENTISGATGAPAVLHVEVEREVGVGPAILLRTEGGSVQETLKIRSNATVIVAAVSGLPGGPGAAVTGLVEEEQRESTGTVLSPKMEAVHVSEATKEAKAATYKNVNPREVWGFGEA